ncbi:hypothetical protein, partial [Nonomuraea aurantiaca]|uniref:hypothetical protein n=1 Tax=Nonomuraea aurantiaca TaxID=2878562 RepID=UPI001CDA3369
GTVGRTSTFSGSGSCNGTDDVTRSATEPDYLYQALHRWPYADSQRGQIKRYTHVRDVIPQLGTI